MVVLSLGRKTPSGAPGFPRGAAWQGSCVRASLSR
jgi:hypothetical protein